MRIRLAVVGAVVALVGAVVAVLMARASEDYEFEALVDQAVEMSTTTTSTTTTTTTSTTTTSTTTTTTTTTTAPPATEAPTTTAAPVPPPPPEPEPPAPDTVPDEIIEIDCQEFLAGVQSHDRLPTSGEVMTLWEYCGIRL